MPGRRAARLVLSRVRGVSLVILLLLAVVAPAASGQEPPARKESPPKEPPAVDVDRLPISVDRVQQGLEREPGLTLIPSQPMFRVEVIEVRPRWFDVEIDWTGGRAGLPTPTRPAWHDQFLSMVTPPEARSFGAFTGTDLLQVMATSVVQGLATQAIASTVRDVVRERRERQAKEEVDEAIQRWKREREEAERAKPAVAPPANPHR